MYCRRAAARATARASFSLRHRFFPPLHSFPTNDARRHDVGHARSFLLLSRAFSSATTPLIRAHGPSGQLTSVLLPAHSTAASALKSRAVSLPDLVLSKRQLCDIELILNGGFSPLTGFMTEAEYTAVVHTMRLPDGTLFPVPVTLDVSEKAALDLKYGAAASVALKDEEGNLIAVLDIADIYKPDKAREAALVFGGDPEHPAIAYLEHSAGSYYIGGAVTGFQLPPHYDHTDIRRPLIITSPP